MSEPFIGSEAVAAGALFKTALRSRYRRLFPDVYINRESDLTAIVLAKAGWLWSGRNAVVAGRSAAAMLGADWITADTAVDLIHRNRNVPSGIKTHADRITDDQVISIDGVPVTSPARTALDLGCWYQLGRAVACLDALARATRFDPDEAADLAARYPGRRGIRGARRALSLLDGGAQSPKETWLRLILIEAGLPRPATQIPVHDSAGTLIAYLDMGWPDLMVAVEYDGEQHRTDRRQYTWDLRRLELLEQLGWIVIRVVAGDRREDIPRRVRAAIARRTLRQSHAERSA